MLYEESVAAEFLQSNTSTGLYNFKDLSKSGIYLTTEPYFKSLLLALHRHRIEKIKLKANIAIDPSKGRNMLGVIDETCSLNYGEVFVQYSRNVLPGETTTDTIVHKGEVLVTKNPCMYPGDVRKFKAVDVFSLHHITDCIVFPQKGPRPHPDEMAGSDLDGDEYLVLWDPDLIFHRSNCEAGSFPVSECPDVQNISVPDMIEFLQNYIISDQVGTIANAHLAHADKQGTSSEICYALAKKFFVAVDFAKNGKCEKIELEERPREYPDFMENIHKRMYKSKKALGKMYRVCKDFESENEVTSVAYENIKVDLDLAYDGWEKYRDSAIKARNKYNALFSSVLRNYGVQHEGEALSGAFTNLHCRFHERRDRNEIEKVIISCIKKLNKCMVDEFMEEFNISGKALEIEEAILQKASAWYMVTYSDQNAKILSFPWAVSKYLINIKVRRTLANPPPFSPLIMDLDQKIQEYDSGSLLPSNRDSVWDGYYILCDQLILKRALHTLILWAQQEEILERFGFTQGLLHMSVFVKLFLHVCEMLGYVSKLYNSVKSKPFCAGQLCLDFLKYCSTFRFYNPFEMENILPFNLYKYDKLAKCAIVSYHKFALTGILQTLNLDEELIEMQNPMYVDVYVFWDKPVSVHVLSSLETAKEALVRYSQVSDLTLREIRQKKKICVTAIGTAKALKKLKYILRKKHRLRRLIAYGTLPEVF